MKNTEWGAVAYLSRSEYGKNGEIWINPNNKYLTGQAGTSESASSTEETYAYTDETYGVEASTTGNIYGIYDMSGGSTEYTAAYVNNSYIQDTGSNYYGYGEDLIKGASYTKDVYVDGTTTGTTDSRENNYAANKGKYGDAVWETSSSAASPYTNSWHQDYSYFPHTNVPFVRLGGYYGYGNASGAGAFCFYNSSGNASTLCSFRPVLVVL